MGLTILILENNCEGENMARKTGAREEEVVQARDQQDKCFCHNAATITTINTVSLQVTGITKACPEMSVNLQCNV